MENMFYQIIFCAYNLFDKRPLLLFFFYLSFRERSLCVYILFVLTSGIKAWLLYG